MPRLRFLLCAVILLLAALPVGAVVVRVNAGASGTNDGTSWADAFTTIQAGIDAASAVGGGEVWVKEGVYTTGSTALVSDSFELRNPDSVDVLGEESHFYFRSTAGNTRWAHLTVIHLSGSTTEKQALVDYSDTPSSSSLATRVSAMLARNPDVLVFANHPYESLFTKDDLLAAANAEAIHGIELHSSDSYIAAWDYVLANLDDQAGACSKVVWGIYADDAHTSGDIGSRGYMMGSIPTAAQDPAYADRRAALEDMIRRGSTVCIKPGRKLGMPEYTLENGIDGTAARMAVGVYVYGAAAVRFYGCSPTTGAPGTLLYSQTVPADSQASVTYHLTTTGDASGASLTPEQKATIRYVRVEIAWTSSDRAILQPVRLRSDGSWWSGPGYEPASPSTYVGASPYPPAGLGGETVYFNTHTHSFMSDGDLPPWVSRRRYNDLYAEIDPSKPRFSILTDHIAVTPFGAQVASVVSLKENVRVYGGFAGTETDLSDRDPTNNLTIIDGQGARRCVYAGVSMTGALLDGFVIANGSAPSGPGGGLFAESGAPQIRNCTFQGNSGGCGGGVCGSGYGSDLAECVIIGNTASDYGGGVFSYAGSTRLASCTLSDNTAREGGGAWISDSIAQISGGTFDGNSALGGQSALGGAIRCMGSVLKAAGVRFVSNTASATRDGHGGAIYSESGNVTISECEFSGNAGEGKLYALGGALYLWSPSVTVDGSSFADNAASGQYRASGGAVYLRLPAGSPSALIRSCVFAGGSAASDNWGDGGALYVYTEPGATANTKLINNTIASNQCSGEGGAVLFDSAVSFSNNIIASNSSGLSYEPNGSDTRLPQLTTNCMFENGVYDYSGLTPGATDVQYPPDFLDESAGDYHLKPTSACVNAGANTITNLPAADMDGGPRICGGAIDIGADEQSAPELSPAAAKGLGTRYWGVCMRGLVVTISVDAGTFYAESEDRSSGIRVLKDAHGLAPGTKLDIQGWLETTADGEKCIRAALIRVTGSGNIEPLEMRGGHIGGGAWMWDPATGAGQQATRAYQFIPGPDGKMQRVLADLPGLNNLGMLVKLAGTITKSGCTTTYCYLYLDDGSQCDNFPSGVAGVRVILPAGSTVPPSGTAVSAVGVVSCRKYLNEVMPQLICRSSADVAPLR